MPAVKKLIKYVISLSIAAFLLWYVYRDLDLSAMIAKLQGVNYTWIVLALILTLGSHVIRAYRWNLLLKPLGYHYLTVFRTFLAVMVGYFANLIIPRMGEVSRCGLLKRTDDVPVPTSLGSVVAERVVDLCSLMVATLLLFILEFHTLNELIFSFFEEKVGAVGQHIMLIYLFIGAVLLVVGLAVFLARIFREKLRNNKVYQKAGAFTREVIKGIRSIGSIEHKFMFWLSTLSIWVIYFFMSYVVFFALPETAGLGWRAGLAVLVMGSLGMSAPVQGGIGTFHALVGSILLLYGISEADGVLFATLVHGMQTLAVVVFGGICFLIASVLATQNHSHKVETKVNN